MPSITFVSPDGAERQVEVESGTTLMMAAIINNVGGIEAECGGSLACGTCHVYLRPSTPAPEPARPDEAEMLDALAGERRPGSRLGCQIVIDERLDGLVVDVPAVQG